MTAKEILALRDDYLTVAEFALLIDRHPMTIYRLVEQGQLPGVIRIGRAIRIQRSVALQPNTPQ